MSKHRQLTIRTRVLQRYSYRMPLQLVGMMQAVLFRHNDFLDRFIALDDLSQYKLLRSSFRTKILVVWTYYVWLLYAVASIVAFLFSVLAGFIMVLILPFIVASALYIVLYFYDSFRNPSIKRFLGYDLELPQSKKGRSAKTKR